MKNIKNFLILILCTTLVYNKWDYSESVIIITIFFIHTI